MEVRDRVKGIHGVVADIISTKRRYETAIEDGFRRQYPEYRYRFRDDGQAVDRVFKEE